MTTLIGALARVTGGFVNLSHLVSLVNWRACA